MYFYLLLVICNGFDSAFDFIKALINSNHEEKKNSSIIKAFSERKKYDYLQPWLKINLSLHQFWIKSHVKSIEFNVEMD